MYIGEACWAFLFGVIIGPYGANIFDPREWGGGGEIMTDTITLEFTRVVLAIGVFAIGVELPKAYMRRHWKSLFFFLGPVMIWGWFVSAGLIYALIPKLNFLSSLAVASCLTPTDPILAAAVVGGKWADKHVPAHLRHLLAAESGCNDGAAFPFLYISLYLLLEAPNTGSALRDWFVLLWVWQISVGILIGSLLGFGVRHLMIFCQRHDLIDRNSYVAKYVSLAMLTIGICTLLGSDDLLAAFACGTSFAWDGFFKKQTEESVFSSVIDLLFNIAAFIFVGAWMPFNMFTDPALSLTVWRLIVIAILILILRRLPIVVALYKWIPDIKTFREAVFSGHFGPIGVGAIFISTLAARFIHEYPGQHTHQADLVENAIQPIVAFMVLCSITIHGLSVPSFSLGRRVHSVSRTWSRPGSRPAPPEWLNQARLVSRGAPDIVVNRDLDDQMERGEARLDEKDITELPIQPSRRVGSPQNPDDTGSSGTTLEGQDQEAPSPSCEEGVRPDGNAPPDGTDLISEWQEPHHRIIERQGSPGEDVEVEVVEEEDAQASHSSHLRRAFRHSLQRLEGLKQTARELEHESSKVIENEVKEIQAQVEDMQHRVREALTPEAISSGGRNKSTSPSSQPRLPLPFPPLEHVENGDDEEGWASDKSASPGRPDARVMADQKKKVKSPKVKPNLRLPSHPVVSGRRGRRTSLRRTPTQPLSQIELTHPPVVTDARGRSPVPVSTHTIHTSRTPIPSPTRSHISSITTGEGRKNRHSRPGTSDSARHQRLERIRALHSSPPTREVSPTRSVWFADEVPPSTSVDFGRSQTSTPPDETATGDGG